jgi:hypothetical protein
VRKIFFILITFSLISFISAEDLQSQSSKDIRLGSTFSFIAFTKIQNTEPTYFSPFIDGISIYFDIVRNNPNISFFYGGSVAICYSQGINLLGRFGILKNIFYNPENDYSFKLKILTSIGIGALYALYFNSHSEIAFEYSYNEKKKLGFYNDFGIMLNTGNTINTSEPSYNIVIGYFISSGIRF